jgi:exonuclease SbcC
LELKKSELQSSLEHAITCPSCKHEFLLDSEKSIEELEKDLSENTELLISNKKSIAENEELISESESHEEAFKLLKEEVKKLERKVSNIESEIEDNETEIVRIEKKNKSIDETISDLKEVKEKTSNIPTYKEKIVEATQKIDDLTIESKKVSKDIEDKDYWLIHLGKKGFQTFLANKCISVIQNLCNKYLEEMKVNLRVKINGYKITSSGELRDKIEVLIVKDEEVEAKFNRFSGGQKERINLAGILTFHNLINSSLNGKGLNLLCLDESLDYLDEKGQKVCLNILQLFDLTTFVISHNSVENLVEDYNKILVKYSNGKSKIETNE